MARESLGSFRLHRWTCDVCTRQVENRSKGNGPIPLPPGWMHVRLSTEDDAGRARSREADVCSTECAGNFTAGVAEESDEAK